MRRCGLVDRGCGSARAEVSGVLRAEGCALQLPEPVRCIPVRVRGRARLYAARVRAERERAVASKGADPDVDRSASVRSLEARDAVLVDATDEWVARVAVPPDGEALSGQSDRG